MSCEVYSAAEARDALRQLYGSTRQALPPLKQLLVPPAMPNVLLSCPGLVSFQEGDPAAALLWNLTEPAENILSATLYAEAPGASAEAVELVFAGFDQAARAARTTYFEIYTGTSGHLRDFLSNAGFTAIRRHLMSLARAPELSSPPAGIHLISFVDLRLSLQLLQRLAELLCYAYTGTPDRAFYRYAQSVEGCHNYLLRLIGSLNFDYAHSLLAWSSRAQSPVGVVLCDSYPHSGALVIEQLAVLARWQRQGVGRALLSQATQEVGEQHLPRAFLAVSEANLPALRLYESLGFATIGIENAYARGIPAAIPASTAVDQIGF